MISSTTRRCAISSRPRQPAGTARCAARSGCMCTWRPSRMLSSTVMPLNSARFWKVRATPQPRHRMRRHAGDVVAFEHDAALLRRVEAGDRVGQRGLAAAVGADQAEDLAAADLQVHAGQRHQAAEAALDLLDLQHCRACGRVRCLRNHRCRGAHRASSARRAAGRRGLAAGACSVMPSSASAVSCAASCSKLPRWGSYQSTGQFSAPTRN